MDYPWIWISELSQMNFHDNRSEWNRNQMFATRATWMHYHSDLVGVMLTRSLKKNMPKYRQTDIWGTDLFIEPKDTAKHKQ